MKNAVQVGVVLLFFAFVAVGCGATTRTAHMDDLMQRVSALDARVNDLEMRQGQAEERTAQTAIMPSRWTDSQGPRQASSQAASQKFSSTQLQTALKNAGFYKGRIDGKVGPQTRQAVKEFQIAHNLKADGVVGRKTRVELVSYLNDGEL